MTKDERGATRESVKKRKRKRKRCEVPRERTLLHLQTWKAFKWKMPSQTSIATEQPYVTFQYQIDWMLLTRR